jgi:hypothetical protein
LGVGGGEVTLRYKCPTCGAWHEGIPDVGYAMPLFAHELTDAERAERVTLSNDLCTLDDAHFFIRCLLHIPVVGTDETFGWGVWSTLSRANYARYVQQFDDDMSDWEPMFGYLANRLPHYPNTLSLKLDVRPAPKGARPSLHLWETDHPLFRDQRDGISLERALEFAADFLH